MIKPGDLVRLKNTGNASVSLWNVREWQLDTTEGKRTCGSFEPDDVGIVIATSEVQLSWKSRLLLVLCRNQLGWQGTAYFEVVP